MNTTCGFLEPAHNTARCSKLVQWSFIEKSTQAGSWTAGIAMEAVGMITDPDQANAILQRGEAGFILM